MKYWLFFVRYLHLRQPSPDDARHRTRLVVLITKVSKKSLQSCFKPKEETGFEHGLTGVISVRAVFKVRLRELSIIQITRYFSFFEIFWSFLIKKLEKSLCKIIVECIPLKRRKIYHARMVEKSLNPCCDNANFGWSVIKSVHVVD